MFRISQWHCGQRRAGRGGVALLARRLLTHDQRYNRGNISDSSAISYKLFGFSGNHKPQSAFDLIFVLSDSRNSWKIPGKVDNRKNVRKYERLQVTIQFITLLDCQSDWHQHRFNLSKPLIISFVVCRHYLSDCLRKLNVLCPQTIFPQKYARIFQPGKNKKSSTQHPSKVLSVLACFPEKH